MLPLSMILFLFFGITFTSFSFLLDKKPFSRVKTFHYSHIVKEETFGSVHTNFISPTESLKHGNWIKIICGASNRDLPLIRNLCYIYTALNVDCFDLSADPTVIFMANEGVVAAMNDYKIARKPIFMISVNDDEDPHFRKASFNSSLCPVTCPRPCEKICPAFAIPALTNQKSIYPEGVIQDKCYGCGRCLSVCPLGLIQEKSYTVHSSIIQQLFQSNLVSAIEIHTQSNHEEKFQELWNKIDDIVLKNVQVLAVSFPDMKEKTKQCMDNIQTIISSSTFYNQFHGIHIWQADGRPMSGDIGKGTTHATCNLAKKILDEYDDYNHDQSSYSSHNKQGIDFHSMRHFVQLAGGANDYSSMVVQSLQLNGRHGFGGYGFGSYARKQIFSYLSILEDKNPGAKVEDYPNILYDCFVFAKSLVSTVKLSKIL